jgi:sRNA-binding carbon storage regulator CsrA
MLGLVRKERDSLVLIQEGRVIGVVQLYKIEDSHRARLRVAAPDEIQILRTELTDDEQRKQIQSLTGGQIGAKAETLRPAIERRSYVRRPRDTNGNRA